MSEFGAGQGLSGRLVFVGLGLGPKGISLEGVETVKSSDVVYLEYYTTPHEPELLKELERATRKRPVVVDREFVEDGKRILEEAKSGRVALCALGDPMIATTHSELRARATREGIETSVVHAATIVSAAASASGLQYYKFSRTVTVTREAVGRLGQAYHLLHQNLLEGAHTVLLLEYDVDSGQGVTPLEAMHGLLLAEANFKRGVVSEATFALVLSRVGREDQSLAAGTFAGLGARDFGEAPHCVVIPGRVHFAEAEAVAAVFGVKEADVVGNSDKVKRTAQTLVPKYVAKTRKALDSLKGKLDARYGPVVENAELYVKDAENFLAEGQDEMAMLSVGYAEGLLDSLSFSGVARIDW